MLWQPTDRQPAYRPVTPARRPGIRPHIDARDRDHHRTARTVAPVATTPVRESRVLRRCDRTPVVGSGLAKGWNDGGSASQPISRVAVAPRSPLPCDVPFGRGTRADARTWGRRADARSAASSSSITRCRTRQEVTQQSRPSRCGVEPTTSTKRNWTSGPAPHGIAREPTTGPRAPATGPVSTMSPPRLTPD